MSSLIKDLSQLRPLFSRKDKLEYILLLMLMFGASALEAVSVGAVPLFISLLQKPSEFSEAPLMGRFFFNLPDEPSSNIILVSSLLLILFIVIKNLFLTFVFSTQLGIVARQGVRLRNRIFRMYQTAPYEWYLQRSSAEILRNIQQDTSAILSSILMPCLDLIMGFVMTIFVVIAIVVTTPGVVVIGLGFTTLMVFLLMQAFRGRLFNYGQQVRAEERVMIQSIQQGFGALAEARIIGCEDYLRSVYKQSATRQASASRRRGVIQRATPYSIETIAIVGLLAILFFSFGR